jgi:hypothetical protein
VVVTDQIIYPVKTAIKEFDDFGRKGGRGGGERGRRR